MLNHYNFDVIISRYVGSVVECLIRVVVRAAEYRAVRSPEYTHSLCIVHYSSVVLYSLPHTECSCVFSLHFQFTVVTGAVDVDVPIK